jgi:hypothetical protein
MGEYSKSIGEYGEKLVDNFLDLIGWKSPQKGIDIPCFDKETHAKKDKKERRSHGIDFIYSYNSPFIDGVLKNIIVSVKFSKSAYLSYPVPDFLNYYDDLATAIECFEHSDNKQEILKGFLDFDSVEDIGVLFWINDNPDSIDDILPEISNVKFEHNYSINSLYVVDNRRIMFIYRVLEFVKSKFSDFNILFYYPNTGKNINPMTKQNSGSSLPVEYLNSSILPLKLQRKDKEKEVYLGIFCIDNYEKEDFKRIIGLSKELSVGLASKVYIGIPNYNEIEHQNQINIIKQQFQDVDFTSGVYVLNYNDKFPQKI